jgi:hypothetical protein
MAKWNGKVERLLSQWLSGATPEEQMDGTWHGPLTVAGQPMAAACLLGWLPSGGWPLADVTRDYRSSSLAGNTTGSVQHAVLCTAPTAHAAAPVAQCGYMRYSARHRAGKAGECRH